MSDAEHVLARIDAVLAEPDMACRLPTCGEQTFGWLSPWCSPRCRLVYRGTVPVALSASTGDIASHGALEERLAARDAEEAEELVAEPLPSAAISFSMSPLRLVDMEAIERELEQAHAVTRPSPVRRVLNLITRRAS